MLCECGCGREVKEGNRFIHGHNFSGGKHTDEAKRKMRDRKISEETKAKLKLAGFRGRKHSDETKRKIGEASKGRQPSLGRRHTAETKKRMSEANRGENAPNWKGGVSFGKYCPKFNENVKESVREQYGRKCMICSKTEDDNDRKLDVHHIDYNKDQGCNGHLWKLVPLCISCHSKTNHNRDYWEEIILAKLEGLT